MNLIRIIDSENIDADNTPLLHATLERITDMGFFREATIYTHKRFPLDAPAYQNPGWLEFTLIIEYVHGNSITIGCIQRQPGAEFEFHS